MLQRCLDIIDGGLVFMWTYLCKSHLFCSFCKYAFSKQHKLLPSLQVYFDCSCSLADQNIMCSASVFGVSTESMQCSYDSRGNSVPTILLMMQRRLYEQGGLRVCFQGSPMFRNLYPLVSGSFALIKLLFPCFVLSGRRYLPYKCRE